MTEYEFLRVMFGRLDEVERMQVAISKRKLGVRTDVEMNLAESYRCAIIGTIKDYLSIKQVELKDAS